MSTWELGLLNPGRLGSRAPGQMGAWTNWVPGCLDTLTFSHLGTWARLGIPWQPGGYLSSWAPREQGAWAPGCLGTRTFGCLGTWVAGLLGPWAPWCLGTYHHRADMHFLKNPQAVEVESES